MSLLKGITIGQYLPGDSYIHNLDPRIKILVTILLIVTLFFVQTFYGYILMLILLFVTVKISGIPIKTIIRGLKPLWFLIAFTLFLHVFFTKGNGVLITLGPITIERFGVRQGVFMASRLALLVMNTSLLTLTTSPIALTDAIEALLSPFKRIGVPAHELAMMMTIALRFIPTLLEETDKIMKAQMARGADFESGNLFQRAKSLIPLLVPLFVSAFRRADELAMAMESRCYRGGEGRTRMKILKATIKDYYSLAGVTLLLIAVIFTGI
ncbi:energy-coupling factor transporter transmembrane protein EcfT [Alkalicella caledoniensis]|uniref:Energy-coupling factor transporter transmembrane protein EcfT n=1 Tax=Alkalicella caledoniensis TaxID=2731377 RepID=A0A7G9W7U6_ALKCA|nr:energy-coupling factor transporter transmembrane component T [Alkalicella caledoniensis]QNO14758.1 energy-coupling factor transporter transmembrane protein EcfT [Alkalicella caledoniensis]